MFGAQSFWQVDDEQVYLPPSHECRGQRPALVNVLRADDQQPAQVDASRRGLEGVEDAAQVEVGDDAAARLGLGEAVQGEGGLAARARAAKRGTHAARQATRAEQRVEPGKAGRHYLIRQTAISGESSGSGWATAGARASAPSVSGAGGEAAPVAVTVRDGTPERSAPRPTLTAALPQRDSSRARADPKAGSAGMAG